MLALKLELSMSSIWGKTQIGTPVIEIDLCDDCLIELHHNTGLAIK